MSAKLTFQTHLSEPSPPWSGLLILPRGSSATAIVKAPAGFLMRTIEGKKCRTSSSLFDEFSQVLSFPDYFGHNWDALEECLADLEWLPAKGYILLITDAHAVLPDDEEEYETLLEILNDAGEAWSKGQTADGRSAPFHAVFAVTEQDKATRPRWELEEFHSAEQKRSQRNPLLTRSAISKRKPTKK
ncbi:MAG: barstar family protein [Nitrospira sp.]|nr:barstar family protein [Nitrospira sp.]MBS0164785.1 barstar family protein [Nitrospira sp.]